MASPRLWSEVASGFCHLRCCMSTPGFLWIPLAWQCNLEGCNKDTPTEASQKWTPLCFLSQQDPPRDIPPQQLPSATKDSLWFKRGKKNHCNTIRADVHWQFTNKINSLIRLLIATSYWCQKFKKKKDILGCDSSEGFQLLQWPQFPNADKRKNPYRQDLWALKPLVEIQQTF